MHGGRRRRGEDRISREEFRESGTLAARVATDQNNRALAEQPLAAANFLSPKELPAVLLCSLPILERWRAVCLAGRINGVYTSGSQQEASFSRWPSAFPSPRDNGTMAREAECATSSLAAPVPVRLHAALPGGVGGIVATLPTERTPVCSAVVEVSIPSVITFPWHLGSVLVLQRPGPTGTGPRRPLRTERPRLDGTTRG
ncbi:hypothetical protein P4O66_013242 [Electrophorus voltai]|uniref:Uncharacterized protein n=1 Tax=Electrophorus voltai TaxID=2609070 RepID=A0AAD9DTJ5_9TELE|nr:hypothetical protein P4O66_013242 [Electrophorus voltai]